MTKYIVNAPAAVWQEIDALPLELRHIAQRVLFQLLDNPVPTLAEPFPPDDPLPGAYRLHLPSDELTIWYIIVHHEGQQVIMVQHVKADT